MISFEINMPPVTLLRILASIIFFTFPVTLFAQNLQQEQREMRRKYNNPYLGENEKSKNVTVFKLRGYTDSTRLILSDLATCKMICFSILLVEIREVLKDGLVNVRRSHITSADKTFAVEYNAGKKLRVIVRPEGSALVIVTVYPNYKTTNCDCNKDEQQ